VLFLVGIFGFITPGLLNNNCWGIDRGCCLPHRLCVHAITRTQLGGFVSHSRIDNRTLVHLLGSTLLARLFLGYSQPRTTTIKTILAESPNSSGSSAVAPTGDTHNPGIIMPASNAPCLTFDIYRVTHDNKEWTIPSMLQLIQALAAYEREPDA
jgi:hypothetical protein